ncbi:MAG: WD40-like Beta Propeller Repeat [Candidatus Kentron sp. G]|nr:MAG: WD40-like Beta Propeller Repeat [Candidatus Kentron sp. G]VFM95983.1 MAG: WD40-like Beta Propeller Repeat [Candidatus Kentron sp. G]VFM97818.1 MAG: WD40-like Beta Propeller Repeat [Candidatus Kentron sp. G]
MRLFTYRKNKIRTPGVRIFFRLGFLLLFLALPVQAGIVYSALEEGAWRLYSQTDPNATPHPVPTPGISGDMGAPRISPDGRKVAFEVTGDGLFVCPLQADKAGNGRGDARCNRLAVAVGYPVRPAWHPKSDSLTFVHYTFDAEEEQATLKRAAITPDGVIGKIEPVIQQTGTQDFPALSPDGQRLAYTAWLTAMPYRGAVQVIQQIWTLDLVRGAAAQLLLSNASDIHPRWSPDGKRIAFSSNRSGRYEIWMTAADGANPRQLTDGPGDKTWPAWSPDGRRILFTHGLQGKSGLSLIRVAPGGNREPEPFLPFGVGSGIQLKDADWRATPW